MNAHLTAEQLERYRRGELSRGERNALYEHVAVCADCARAASDSGDFADQFEFLRADLRDAGEEQLLHLSYEERERFVDEQMDAFDREVVESHLGVCASCAADVEKLQLFRASLATPAASSSAAAIATTPSSRQNELAHQARASFWRRFIGRRARSTAIEKSSPAGSWFVQHAFAAAVVLTMIVGGAAAAWWLTRSDADNLRARRQPAPEQPDSPIDNKALSAATPPPGVVRLPTQKPQTDVPEPTGDDRPSRPPTTPPSSRVDQLASVPAPRLSLRDGGRVVTLGRAGDVSGLPSSLSARDREDVRLALSTAAVRRPEALRVLGGKGSMQLLDNSAAPAEEGVPFALLGPFRTIILSDTPTLRWRAFAGATSYAVTVADAEGRVVARGEQLSSPEWTVPTALERGATYSWQVAARLPDESVVRSPTPPAPPARFAVVTAAVEQELRALERVDSPLARGVLYAERGLREEAEREFQKLQGANPDSRVARELLRAVRSW